MSEVFVFGSNKQGIHGKGAAQHAMLRYGAEPGVGLGRTGNAYAIPTKTKPTREIRQLPLSEIAAYIEQFKSYAAQHPEDLFLVTAVGCGLAGYLPAEIGPMFDGCTANVRFLDDQLQQKCQS